MLNTRDLVYCALFAALVAGLGVVPPIPLAFLPVPITAQTLGVMLAGLLIGAKRGGIALVLFVLLVAAGLPVLAGGRGGIGVLMGPTAGFILGWIPGAVVTGLIAERLGAGARPVPLFVAAAVGGVAVVYAVGIPWLWLVAGLPLEKAAMGTLAFLPGDLIKSAVAAFTAAAVHRAGVMTARA